MISELILKLRKAKGWTQEELAQKMDLSRPTLASIENGTRDISLSELKKLSAIFDIPLPVILDEDLKLDQKITQANPRQTSFQKFHDLVLKCIKYGADEDGKITKTKLAKLVYLCDFANYYQHLTPISGFEYRRLAQGPVAIEFFDLIDNDESICLETKGRAILVSLIEDPKDTILSRDEEKIIKAVCAKWKNSRTKEIVDFTHQQLPCFTCKEGEVIPYELINMEDPANVY